MESPVIPLASEQTTGSSRVRAMLAASNNTGYSGTLGIRLASAWCQDELNAFLASSVKDRKSNALKRLFMVSRDRIDRLRLPDHSRNRRHA
jgi:hypothetical protein